MNYPRFSTVPNSPLSSADVIDSLRDLKVVRDAVAARAAKTFDRRTQLSAQIAGMHAEAETAWAREEKQIADTRADFEAAQARLLLAQHKFFTALNGRSIRCATFTVRHSEIEAELLATCDPAADLFIREMENEWEKTCRQTRIESTEIVHNQITGKKAIVSESNRARVIHRMDAIREAQNSAREMKLEPDQNNVAERLQALREALPAV